MTGRRSASLVRCALVVVLAATAGCAAESTRPLASGTTVSADPEPTSTAGHVVAWEGVRTDRDPQVLVVAYTGGSCDGPAELVVTDDGAAVTAALTIHGVLGADPSAACDAAGHGRSARGHLPHPLAARPVVDAANGKPHVAFDGSRLLAPSPVPAGRAFAYETGSGDRVGDAASGFWVRAYNPPDDGECSPTVAHGIAVTQGLTAQVASEEWEAQGHASVGHAEAAVLRDRISGDLALTWRDADSGQVITVSSQVLCADTPAPSLADMQAIAASLA